MIEEGRNLLQCEPALGCPFDQTEKRPQFLLGCDQRGKTRPKDKSLAADPEALFAAMRIGLGHSAATSPELSSASV